jgi:gamma-glutamyltranspeptidase/glutathione hydrolase
MALKDGRPSLVFGTMGGSVQPQVHLQVLTNVVDFHMDAQRALDAPRWAMGGMAHDDVADDLNLEAPLAEAATARLEALGHRVVRNPSWSDDFGHAHAIRVHQDSGVLEAGADPRSDGAAVGW